MRQGPVTDIQNRRYRDVPKPAAKTVSAGTTRRVLAELEASMRWNLNERFGYDVWPDERSALRCLKVLESYLAGASHVPVSWVNRLIGVRDSYATLLDAVPSFFARNDKEYKVTVRLWRCYVLAASKVHPTKYPNFDLPASLLAWADCDVLFAGEPDCTLFYGKCDGPEDPPVWSGAALLDTGRLDLRCATACLKAGHISLAVALVHAGARLPSGDAGANLLTFVTTFVDDEQFLTRVFNQVDALDPRDASELDIVLLKTWKGTNTARLRLRKVLFAVPKLERPADDDAIWWVQPEWATEWARSTYLETAAS